MKEEDFENDNDDDEEENVQDQECNEDLRWERLINFEDKKDDLIHYFEGKRIKTEIKEEEDEAIACQKVKSIKISTLIKKNLFTCHISRIWIWTLLDLFQERQDH